MPVAEELAEELMGRFAFQKESPRRFNRDNTIELQMPFVKALLDPAQILALGVPPTVTSLAIGRTVADWALQKGLRTKIIGSTDLTHYGRNYDFTPHGSGAQALAWVRNENDRRVIDAMAAMDSERIINEGLDHQNACCAGAVAAAVAALQRLGADTAHQVAYATSHDRIPGESFVGYVGMLFGHID
jgi:AmmeMemoRadiSam system protein B